MKKMAGLIDFSLRDLRDKFLADLAKTECELREHLVNTMAVAQVRASGTGSGVVANTEPKEDTVPLHDRIEELESELITNQAALKKLRKENVELQGLVNQNKNIDELEAQLEAQLEAAHRQIRGLTQENLALKNTAELNDKYAAQDKKAYAELSEKYASLEANYNELRKSTAKPETKAEEPKKEVKKVVKPAPEPESAQAPNPEPEEEEQEEEAEEEAEEAAEEEEGEEPVEFEYKGKTYYLSSDNDVYEEQEGEFVQVGTWNGKKIIFG